MKLDLCWAPAFALLLVLPAAADAAPVGVAYLENNTGWADIFSSVRLQLSVGDRFWSDRTTILDTIVDPSDIGTIYSFNSGPLFSRITAMLTNGVNDMILLGGDPALPGYGGPPYAGGSGGLTSEARAFFGDDTGANGTDFRGFTITSIDLEILHVAVESPGENPNGDGNWTNFEVSGMLSIYATPIPEPSAFLLVSGGVLAFVLTRVRRA